MRGSNPSAARAVIWAEICLWTAGLAALGYCTYIWTEARVAQDRGYRELSRPLPERGSVAPAPLAAGALVGRVDIARLNLSAIVFEGTGNSVLDEGVGHMQGTALPGQNGNIVLAAHRDTFFRALRNIHNSDIVTVSTPLGLRRYEVEWTRVVSPFDTGVAAPTSEPALTLITCYPFEFFGHAPERFVVRAREMPNEPAIPVTVPAKPAPPRRLHSRPRPLEPAPPPPSVTRVSFAQTSIPAPPPVHAVVESDPPPPARHKHTWLHPLGLVKKLVHR